MLEPSVNRARKIIIVLKITWIMLSFIVLAYSFRSYEATYNPETEILLAYLMGALSFPSSFLVILLMGSLARVLHHFSVSVPSNHTTCVLVWLAFFIAGYLQWFKLLPFLWMKLSAK